METKPLLFITFNENEQASMKNALKNAETSYFSESGVYITKGIFGNNAVLHYHCPNQGDAAELNILRVLTTVPCSAIVMVGIACGANIKENDNSQKIGDVLLCKYLINAREKRVGNEIIHRGEKVSSGDRLYEMFFGAIDSWKTSSRENGSYAEVYAGSIISGAELIDNFEAKKTLFNLFKNEPVGYEMEGTSLFRVCHSREVGKTEWIIVKGISDFGDGDKGKNKEECQILAAKNAVSFCLHVFSHGEYYGASKSQLNFMEEFGDLSFDGNVEKVIKEIKNTNKSHYQKTSDVSVLEAEIDNSYEPILPDSIKLDAFKKQSHNEAFNTISVKLYNSGNKTAFINRLCVDVEEYIVDETPHFYFCAETKDGQLIISSLNNGWGEAHDVTFNIQLTYVKEIKEIKEIKFKDANKNISKINSISSNEKAVIFCINYDDLDLPLDLKKNTADTPRSRFFRNLFCNHQKEQYNSDGIPISIQISCCFNHNTEIITRGEQVHSKKKDEYICIENKMFVTSCADLTVKKKCIFPDVFYASVITAKDIKTYKISRTIAPDEVDAFNLYIGSNKTSQIKFRLVFLQNCTEIAKTDLIVVNSINYTNSYSYDRYIDGCEIDVENFKKKNRFNFSRFSD